MSKILRCELVDLRDVYDLTYQLALKIIQSGYRPDLIIAIARGGFVPARFMCDFLNISDMSSIKVQHYGPGAHNAAEAFVKYPLNTDIKGRKILLVDDINDTGDTLEAALEHLITLKPLEIKSCVMHEKNSTKFSAGYYASYITDWHWVIYPWAVVEDVGNFIQEMGLLNDGSLTKISKQLKENYDIEMKEELIRNIIKLVKSRTN